MWLALFLQAVPAGPQASATAAQFLTEEKIACARQFYNVNALDYDTRIQSFPGNQLAQWFRFEPVVFFEAEAGVSQEVQVSLAKG
jgi:hypothetical protein